MVYTMKIDRTAIDCSGKTLEQVTSPELIHMILTRKRDHIV